MTRTPPLHAHRSTPVHEVHVQRRSRRTRVAPRPVAVSSSPVVATGTPVEGVAIVGCQLNRSEAERQAELKNVLAMLDTLEPVMPLRMCHSPPSADSEADLDCESVGPNYSFSTVGTSSFPRCRALSPTDDTATPNTPEESQPRAEFSSGAHGSVPRSPSDNSKRAGAQWPSEDKPCSRSLLNKGYIMFSDEFIEALQGSSIRSLTEQYRESVATTEPALHVDPQQTERQQRIVEACHYLSLAESEYRPLFRRRDADLVYGRASYIPAPVQS